MSSEVLSIPSLQALQRKQLEEQWKREFEQIILEKKQIAKDFSMLHHIMQLDEQTVKKPNIQKQEVRGLYTEWEGCRNASGNQEKSEFLLTASAEETKYHKGKSVDYSGNWMKEKKASDDKKKTMQGKLLEYCQKREREYIALAMKSVFEENGISYSDMSEIKENGNLIQYCQVDGNGKTELWIENTANGEFLMEVVGKANHLGNESDEEKRIVQEEAQQICTKYIDIKNKLLEWGIDIDFKLISDPVLDPIRFVEEYIECKAATEIGKEMRMDDT